MRICAIVDTKGHCFTTTVQAMAARSRHQIDVQTSSEHGAYRRSVTRTPYDLLYFRSWWPKLQPWDGMPYIVTITTGGPVATERLREIAEAGDPAPRAVVAQNGTVQQQALSLGLSSALIPNGVDSSLYYPGQPAHSAGVGLAGSLSTPHKENEKGSDLCETAVTMAGMRFVRASGIQHALMPNWYQSLWAYCQPSVREGCSNSVMEAMASGLPCLICRGVGYHGEVCRDAREHPDGEVLFVHRNSADIARALEWLNRGPDNHARTARNARRFAEAHSWAVVAERFDQLFEWAAEKPQ